MVTINERVEDAKLRVFKWKDQSLFTDTVSEFGLFMFLLANHIQIKSEAAVEEKTKNITKVSGFKVANLLSRNSIQLLVASALSSTGLFFQDTVQYLAQQISSYILLNFHFTTDSLLGRDRSRIVIVIDLNMLRVVDYINYNNNNNNNTPEAAGENKYNCLPGKDEEEEEENDLVCMQSYLDEILGDEDEKQDQNLLEEEEEEEEEQVLLEEEEEEGRRSEIMEIARELMPFLIETPEILAQTKPKLSVHFRDFEKIRPPVKIEVFDGQLELCMCSICGSRVLTETVVAKLPCLHLFHRDCIYQSLPNFNSCPLCGLACATFI